MPCWLLRACIQTARQLSLAGLLPYTAAISAPRVCPVRLLSPCPRHFPPSHCSADTIRTVEGYADVVVLRHFQVRPLA